MQKKEKLPLRKFLPLLFLASSLPLIPILLDTSKKVNEINHSASQQTITSTANYLIKDARTLVEQKEDGYKIKFDLLKLAAEELSVPESLKMKITSDSITIYNPSYPTEKIILTVPTPGELNAEAIGFDVEEKSSE